MLVFDSVPATAAVLRADEPLLNEAELAAVAFLACYSGRTRRRTVGTSVST